MQLIDYLSRIKISPGGGLLLMGNKLWEPIPGFFNLCLRKKLKLKEKLNLREALSSF